MPLTFEKHSCSLAPHPNSRRDPFSVCDNDATEWKDKQLQQEQQQHQHNKKRRISALGWGS